MIWKRCSTSVGNVAKASARNEHLAWQDGNVAEGEREERASRLAGETMISFNQFLAVDMRVGRVTEVQEFPEARKPAWKLTIDFGPEVGVKRSSAQITNYAREELVGRLVVAVVNFPPRQIGPFLSEVLCLGASDEEGRVILLEPRSEVPLGSRIH
jgi:tRNA-binding protein